MTLFKPQSLQERILGLACLDEVTGYVDGLAMQERRVRDLEAQLLERRVEALSSKHNKADCAKVVMHIRAVATKSLEF